jgi:hypothetical protein
MSKGVRPEYSYTNDTLLSLTNWPRNRLNKDVSDGRLKPDNLASVAAWLAANGKDWVRAAILAELVPSFGEPEMLALILRREEVRRKSKAKKPKVKSA